MLAVSLTRCFRTYAAEKMWADYNWQDGDLEFKKDGSFMSLVGWLSEDVAVRLGWPITGIRWQKDSGAWVMGPNGEVLPNFPSQFVLFFWAVMPCFGSAWVPVVLRICGFCAIMFFTSTVCGCKKAQSPQFVEAELQCLEAFKLNRQVVQ
jgi:hypothetical protein